MTDKIHNTSPENWVLRAVDKLPSIFKDLSYYEFKAKSKTYDFYNVFIFLRISMQHGLQSVRHEIKRCFSFCFVLTVTQSYGIKG